jgi:mannose-1-phosphate guanylyltransferase
VKYQPNTWVLVLAAGDGTRLASLTTDKDGRAVPKQFCSLNGGHSLLQASLRRSRMIVPRQRICAIVARSHEHYWRRTLRSLPEANVIVQPRNCGTANGLLLGVLRILERDPLARIIFMPADHHVLDEQTLIGSVRTAAELLGRDPEGALRERLLLIGISPEEADTELGYIVQGAPLSGGIRLVKQFIENPTADAARALIARGAVWNSFILAAHGTAVIARIRERFPQIVNQMIRALRLDAAHGTCALVDLYEHLDEVDFSRSVAQGAESALCVYTAPPCGWTHLCTPRRVAAALHRLWTSPRRRALLGVSHAPAFINLASRLTIAGCLVVLSVSGCGSMKAASTATPTAAQAAAPPDDSRSPPVESPPAASPPAGPGRTADTAPPVTAPPVKPDTTSNPTKSTKQPVAPPPVPAAPATKPGTAPAVATLDLGQLEARLRDTHAIGVFTKLSLKNQVDDLLDEFRAFYRASNKNPTTELHRHYDVLLVKVLGLLRDGDPALAAAVASSREAIWGILADPDKFAKL